MTIELSLFDFLGLALPPDGEGFRCAVAIRGKKIKSQKFYPTNAALEAALREIDQQGAADAYFACSTFKDPAINQPRSQRNVQSVKSFWLDVDAGQGKPYTDADAALASLKDFLAKTGLPAPMIVCSGHGLHCYFLLSEPIPAKRWKPLGERLKSLCAAHGFHADPMRTADHASILRPIGTMNRKFPDAPRPVTLLSSAVPVAIDEIETILKAPKGSADLGAMPPHLLNMANLPHGLDLGSFTAPQAPILYTPDNLDQLNSMLGRIEANCDRPPWFSILCGIKNLHFDHGWPKEALEKAAHDWSKRGTGKGKYSEEEFSTAWNSINPRDESQPKSKIGTVIHHARQGGWNGHFSQTTDAPAAQNLQFKNTDMGNAERLVARHGENIRFIPEMKSWMIWNGQRWMIDKDGWIDRLAKATVKAMHQAALDAGDETQMKFALGSQKADRLAAMIRLAQTEAPVILSVATLDADPLLLGVKNGVVDLRTGQFRAGRKEDFITMTAGAEYVSNAACPHWLSFIKKLCADDRDLIDYIQKAHGYMLTGLVVEEAVFLECGGGSNGKTTKREIMREVMGAYATTADASLLMERKQGGATPELARLRGKRLVLLSETAEDGRLNEQRVKTLCSNETISARELYKGFFDFQPTHKVLLTTNHRPIVHGTDDGIWRRIHLLISRMTIEDKDKIPDYRERFLLPELSGILNWLIEGARRYLTEGLKPLPASVEASRRQYRSDMDTVGQFLQQETELDPQAKEPLSQIRTRYEGWCQREGNYPLGAKKFNEQLREKGFHIVTGAGNYSFIMGLRLKTYHPDFHNIPPSTMTSVVRQVEQVR